MQPKVTRLPFSLVWTVFLAIGIFVLGGMYGFERDMLPSNRPGYFPLILAGLLVASALSILIDPLAGRGRAAERIDLASLLVVLKGTAPFCLLLRPAGSVAALIVRWRLP